MRRIPPSQIANPCSFALKSLTRNLSNIGSANQIDPQKIQSLDKIFLGKLKNSNPRRFEHLAKFPSQNSVFYSGFDCCKPASLILLNLLEGEYNLTLTSANNGRHHFLIQKDSKDGKNIAAENHSFLRNEDVTCGSSNSLSSCNIIVDPTYLQLYDPRTIQMFTNRIFSHAEEVGDKDLSALYQKRSKPDFHKLDSLTDKIFTESPVIYVGNILELQKNTQEIYGEMFSYYGFDKRVSDKFTEMAATYHSSLVQISAESKSNCSFR